MDNAGKVIDDNKEMCEILSNYLSSVITVENVNNLPKITTVKNGCQPEQMVNNLESIDITEERILHAMKIMKVNKTGGVDEFNLVFF